MPRFSPVLARLAAAGWLAAVPLTAAAMEKPIEEPRPLSAAEEAAIGLALDYLDR